MANISWISTTSGDWYDAANWDTGTIPGEADTATINVSGENVTITFSQGEPDVIGINLFAREGAVLSLPGLTSYTGSDLFGTNTTIEATGEGSQIDLSNVVTLTGATGFIGQVNLNALSGGEIDLSGVTTIPGGATAVLADGTDSVVDLTSLTSFVGSGESNLVVSDGGTLVTTNLTSIEAVNLRNNSGTIDTSQLTNMIDSSILVDGSNTFDTSMLTNIDGSSIFARNGGTIALPSVTSYVGDIFSTLIEASGEGSQIDLSNVGILTGAAISSVEIKALSGGEVDLSGMTTIPGGATQVLAEGTDSVVDLTSLTSFVDNNGSGESNLVVSDGGTLVTTNLTSIEAVNLRNNSGTIDTSQLTNMIGSSILVDGSNTFDTSMLTNIDGSSIFARNGGTIALPSVTSYVGGFFSTFIEASGEGSQIDLSNVGTLTGGAFSSVEIKALSGGEVDLSGVTNIPGGATQVLAEGTDSVVDLTSLTSFVDNARDPSTLEVRDGGTLVTTNLSSIEAVNLRNNSGTIDTSQLTNMNNGSSLLVDGSNRFDTSMLTNIDGSSIFARNGGTIALPSVTSYVGDDIFSTVIEASGEGSQIDLSNIGTLTGGAFGRVEIQALSGGEVDLSGVTTIPGGATAVLAEGTDSVVDLTSLTSFVDNNGSGESNLEVSDGGTLVTTNLSSIEAVNLRNNSGTIDTSQLTNMINRSSILVDGSNTFDTSMLTNIDGSSIFARNGGTIALPSVTSYVGDDIFSTVIEASGEGSQIDLSNVGTLTGGAFNSVEINALSGGEVDLSGVTTIPEGNTEALADGTRSWLSLSSLTDFTADNLSLDERNGGEIVIPDDGIIIPTISIASDADPTEEDITRGTFTVNLSDPAPTGGITIGYDVGGTATLFRDYSLSAGSGDVTLEDTFFILGEGQTTGTINVEPVDDRFSDPDETVQIIFSPSSRYNLSSNDSAVVTISDNDITVNIAPGATPSEAGPTNGTYIITLSDPVSNEGLILDYTVTGSATQDADYSLSAGAGVTNITGNQITLAEGSTTATVNLIPITDAITDPEETVRLAITGSPRYQIGSNNSATLSITDSEGGPGPGPINLDIDGNGSIGGFSDGILFLRDAIGLTGDALINGAIGEGATRTTSEEIIAYLDSLGDTVLDVDGNGTVGGFSDGILFLRYAIGLTGDALINGAIGDGATRTTADAIIAHLESFAL